MDVGDLLLAVAPAEIRVHGAALDRAGPDQRDFHHEVVEAAGPQPRQRGHLGPALDLEHADGVGRAQQVVDLGFLRDRREVDLDLLVGADEVDREVQHRQHAQPEQVELHEARRRAVVLVPLEHRPAFHARPLDRAELHERAVGHHHAAGMDAEVAREVDHLGRERERERRDRRRSRRGRCGVDRLAVAPHVPFRPLELARVPRVLAKLRGLTHRNGGVLTHFGCGGELVEGFGTGRPAVHPLAERIGLTGWEAGGLRHLPQRGARAVGDDVRHLRGAVAAVPLVDVLDHFLAALVLDVEVDVGRAVALG